MAYNPNQFAFAFRVTPWVKRLLVANTALFLFTALVGRGLVFDWFAFHPSRILTQPWGVVTYMFLHGDLWHLLLNMLVLFFFGPPLEDRWGSSEFLRYYLICGLGGVALSFLFASGSSIIGASAAVYGVMLAFAMTWPDSPIYVWGIFPVKAKWLATFLFVLSFFSAFGGAGGGVAHFAHLGGLVTGFLYLKSDGRMGAGLSRIRESGPSSRRVAVVPKERTSREVARPGPAAGESRRGWRDADEEALLDKVDRVLDKISATGIGSLSPEERKLLDEVSKRHRSN